MSKSLGRRRPADPLKAAEAAFKKITAKPIEGPSKAPSIPGVKETVTLRIDQDVLEYFQQDGPGWQERINAAFAARLRASRELSVNRATPILGKTILTALLLVGAAAGAAAETGFITISSG